MFLWTLALAVERHQLIGENRRLAQAERNRLQQEQRESQHLLDAQRALCEHFAAGPVEHERSLPAALGQHYRELLRAHVIMGSGNLSTEMSALAGALDAAQVSAAQALSLHVAAVADLVRGLGSRGARHVMTRADLLIVELLVGLDECRDGDRRYGDATSLSRSTRIK
jgi:hypothetical protein